MVCSASRIAKKHTTVWTFRIHNTRAYHTYLIYIVCTKHHHACPSLIPRITQEYKTGPDKLGGVAHHAPKV